MTFFLVYFHSSVFYFIVYEFQNSLIFLKTYHVFRSQSKRIHKLTKDFMG